jgi:uncharacterized protein (DUF488 family)
VIPLLTIGYAAGTQAGLIAALAAEGATVLADVRALANSRKPGFAKRNLAAGLAQAGIEYWHLPALGTPSAGRDAARAGRIADMHRIFRSHLAGTEAQAALAALTARTRDARVCLLCLEDDPAGCHRTLVAEAVSAATGAPIRHLHPI